MSTPLYGNEVTTKTIEEVHAMCVAHFANSTSRGPIWDGIGNVLRQTFTMQQVEGVIWCDSEFTENINDPQSAALLMLPSQPVTKEVVQCWLRDNLSEQCVHTHLIPPIPDNHPKRAQWQVFLDEHKSEFTEDGTKGVPEIPLKSCRDYFTS